MFLTSFFSICERQTISVRYNAARKEYSYTMGVYDPTAVARGIFQDDYQYQGGWKELHIEASGYGDDILAHAAGFAEGVLTQPLFENHYLNTMTAICKDFIAECTEGYKLPDKVVDFFVNNYNWVVENVSHEALDTEYRWGANISMNQFNGLYDGYSKACVAAGTTPISITDFWMYQCRSEILDAYRGLYTKPNVDPRLLLDRRGSFIISSGASFSNLYMAHSSWRSYAEATKITKRYRILYQNSYNVVSRKSFSSYPLMMHSDEGLTITDQGLVIAASSIMIDEKTVHTCLNYSGLPHWLREVVSDQTSHTAFDWSDTYSHNPSMTCGVEWIVINLKRFVVGEGILSNLINVIEEIPERIVYQDLTQHIKDNKYFGSFDIPFDEDIYIKAGYNRRAQTDPELYSRINSSRYQILNEEGFNLVTRQRMHEIMRYNDISQDFQLGRTDLGMSPREENTIDTPKLCRGAIDAKYTDVERALHLEWDGVVGPMYDDTETYKPFKFADYPDVCGGIRHEGVADELKYDWFGNYFDLDV